MRTLHHHNHQGPGPYDHGAGSEFLLYPAGQLLSSDDEAAAGGASPRGSSADGSEDGTNFIQVSLGMAVIVGVRASGHFLLLMVCW